MSREAFLRRIATGGPVTFRDAMDAALNDADDGWYGSGRVSIGTGGDFTTSPELSPLFGACVATWIAKQWTRMGQPPRFEIVEFGAGQGRLASAMLEAMRDELPDAYTAVHVRLVEKSATMRSAATEAVRVHSDRVDVVDTSAFRMPEPGANATDRASVLGPTGSDSGLATTAATQVPTIVVSNEFVDALPVHVCRWRDNGDLEELYVSANASGTPAEEWGTPSSPRLEDFARRFVPHCREYPQTRFEAAIDAWDWADAVTRTKLVRSVLTVDYGDTSERIAGPHFPEGTLRALRDRRPIADVVSALWQADLTSDVNFDVVSLTGVHNGWTASPLVPQSEWLARMGIFDRIASATTSSVGERLAMKTLAMPDGLGERMKVLEMFRDDAGDDRIRQES